MAEAEWEMLKKELRAEPPASLETLEPKEIQRLAEAVRAARKKQQADMATAMESALKHVPALLRGTVRKIFLS